MTYDICQIFQSTKNYAKFQVFLSLLFFAINIKIDEYNKVPDYAGFYLLQNYITFFMVLVLNLKKYPQYIKLIFNGKIKFVDELYKAIINLKTSKKEQLLNIVNNLFLKEYKEIFFIKGSPDEELEKIFIEEQTKFSKVIKNYSSFFDDQTYTKMFEKLYALELSYDNFFDNNEQVPIESRGVYKLIIIQSIIRIIFSKEKKNLYSQEEFY